MADDGLYEAIAAKLNEAQALRDDGVLGVDFSTYALAAVRDWLSNRPDLKRAVQLLDEFDRYNCGTEYEESPFAGEVRDFLVAHGVELTTAGGNERLVYPRAAPAEPSEAMKLAAANAVQELVTKRVGEGYDYQWWIDLSGNYRGRLDEIVAAALVAAYSVRAQT